MAGRGRPGSTSRRHGHQYFPLHLEAFQGATRSGCCVVVVVSLPFYFLSLDLPKSIVNGPIQGQGFSSPTDTETAMRIAFDLPELAVRRRRDRAFQRHRVRPHHDAHLSLRACSSSSFSSTATSSSTSRPSRAGSASACCGACATSSSTRCCAFRCRSSGGLRSSEIATMVKDEVEPLGGFIGDAFVQPAYLLSQAITAMVFILMQSDHARPRRGRHRRRADRADSAPAPPAPGARPARQLTARQLAGRVGEIVEGITGIRVNDTSNWERAEIVGAARRGSSSSASTSISGSSWSNSSTTCSPR